MYNEVLLSQEMNELMLPATTRMDLESTILSEISQHKKENIIRYCCSERKKGGMSFSLSLS